eukprot:Lithocolla_globosa_v1_NODE_3020_length_1792_cov_38.840823.p1 type:complete len:191 gc:universal NODE_3020_length_1792_cov_38.840823:1579-1007(-)
MESCDSHVIRSCSDKRTHFSPCYARVQVQNVAKYRRDKEDYKFQEMSLANGGGRIIPNRIFKWTQEVPDGYLPDNLTRQAITNLYNKWESVGRDVEKTIHDNPRSQTNRTGKYAPVSSIAQNSMLKMAKDSQLPRHKRRSFEISQEKHDNRKFCGKTVRNQLKKGGLSYFKPIKTISMKHHHRQFRLRWA